MHNGCRPRAVHRNCLAHVRGTAGALSLICRQGSGRPIHLRCHVPCPAWDRLENRSQKDPPERLIWPVRRLWTFWHLSRSSACYEPGRNGLILILLMLHHDSAASNGDKPSHRRVFRRGRDSDSGQPGHALAPCPVGRTFRLGESVVHIDASHLSRHIPIIRRPAAHSARGEHIGMCFPITICAEVRSGL